MKRTVIYPDLPDIYIEGIDMDSLNEEEQAVLSHQAVYCQAMINADIDAMRKLVTEDKTYRHMSGRVQTKEEYFADVKTGSLRYYRIGIENPVMRINGNRAELTYTSVLTANAYGAKGAFHMKGTHYYEKRNQHWIECNQ